MPSKRPESIEAETEISRYPFPVAAQATPLTRLSWLDFARGTVIAVMLLMHSYKTGAGAQISSIAYEHLPHLLQFFTFAFVALSGLGLVILRDRLEDRHGPIGPYCRQRALRLLAVAFVLRLGWIAVGLGRPEFDFSSLAVGFLTLGDGWHLERFIARIAVFVFLAPMVLPSDRRPFSRPLIGVGILGLVLWHGLGSWLEPGSGVGGIHPVYRATGSANLISLLVGCLGVFAGSVCRRIPPPHLGLRSLIAGVIGGAVGAEICNRSLDLEPGDAAMVFVIIGEWVLRLILVICFGELVDRHGSSAVRALLRGFGIYPFFVYEVHRIPIWVAARWHQQVLAPQSLPVDLLFLGAVVLLTFGISVAAIRFRRRFPTLDRELKTRFSL